MRSNLEYASTRRAYRPEATPHGNDFTSLHSDAANIQTIPTIGEVRQFDAELLLKRSESWACGKAILVERQPHAELTQFAHCLKRHTIALHVEGANTQLELRHNGGRRITITSTLGQVMLIPSGHKLEGWSDYPTRVGHMIVLVDSALIEAELQEESGIKTPHLPFHVDLKDGVIASQMRALQSEFENPGLLRRLYVESLSCEIATRLVRRHAAKSPTPQRGGLSPRRLREVKDYIEANLSKEITLGDLAALAGLSKAHFCRAFQKSVGIASHRYIVRQRIEVAKRLLVESKMPIAEVALASGFGDQSHFTKHFRYFVGTTPWRFRNQA
jgi:AraC family transcriptional regulator